MEQRIGRIIRQGNVNETVSVVNMVARRSYDAMMYQYVARKASFVHDPQGRPPPSMEHRRRPGGVVAQSKAAATGDPVFVQQVEADQRVRTRRPAATPSSTPTPHATRRSACRRHITATEKQIPERRADTPTSSTSGRSDEDRAAKMWNFPTGPVADGDTADLGDATPSRPSSPHREVTKSKDEGRSSCSTRPPSSSPTSRSSASSTSRSVHGEVVRPRWMNNVLERASTRTGNAGHHSRLAAAATERIPAMEAQLDRDREKLAAAQAEPELEFTPDR
ncbi:hypothetical protein GS908_26385 [Rhodococcus hoagii]|nr:hypothetical protein [Prescottella equi]